MVSNLQVAASVLPLALNVPKNGIEEAVRAHSAEARKEAAKGNGFGGVLNLIERS